MVAVKSSAAAQFLKSVPGRHTAFLVFGGDAGLVSERAGLIARACAAASDPEGDIIRLDDADLDSDPDRIAIELGTVAMFGGRRIVRTTTGRRVNAAMLKPLIDGPPLDGILIVEAGSLKTDDSLRTAFEKSDRAAAIACYGDEAADLDGILNDMLRPAHRTIDAEARAMLLARLGADRALSRGEIEKLILYTHGAPAITAADVEAIVGDASELAIDRVISAAVAGAVAPTVSEYARALAAGENVQGILIALERHLHRLHRVRVVLDKGRPLDEALRALRPPLFYKQRDAFMADVRAWSAQRLMRAIVRLTETLEHIRRSSLMEEVQGERALLAIASLAREGRAAARPRG